VNGWTFLHEIILDIWHSFFIHWEIIEETGVLFPVISLGAARRKRQPVGDKFWGWLVLSASMLCMLALGQHVVLAIRSR